MGRADAIGAIELFVEGEVPFRLGELIIFAEERERSAGGHMFAISLILKETIWQAMRTADVRPLRLRSMGLATMDWTDRCRLADAVRRYPRFPTRLIGLGLAALAVWANVGNLNARQLAIHTLLDQQVQEASRVVSQLADQAARSNAMASALGSSMQHQPASVLAQLVELRSKRPASLEIARITFSQGSMSLSIQSDDVLRDVEVLSHAMGEWTASLESPIQTQRGGLETAVIRLGHDA
jgi:hypothetical protein